MEMMRFLSVVAVLAVLPALSFAQATLTDCSTKKVSNCTTDDFQELPLVFYPALPTAAIGGVSQEHQNLSLCFKVFHVKICVDLTSDDWSDYFQNITLTLKVEGIPVLKEEITLPEFAVDGGWCIDDDTILEILALTLPADDLEGVLKALEATGCSPRGLFSLCINFNEVATCPQPGPCGCFDLKVQLLYYLEWCAYQDNHQIGCIGDPQD